MTRPQMLKLAALVGMALIAAPTAVPADPAQAPPASKKGEDQCFLSRDVNGFSAPNNHTVYIRVGVRSVYRLDLMKDCIDLTFRQSLGLESTPANPWICNPLDATVVYRETGIPDRCPVTAIHKLTAEELAALPKRDLP